MSSRERVIPDACELIKFNNVIEKSFLSLFRWCVKKKLAHAHARFVARSRSDMLVGLPYTP